MLEPMENHYRLVLRAFLRDELTLFLGAGVNLCDRPNDEEKKMVWQQEQTQYLPSGGELAAYLADDFFYPGQDRDNLLRISQYVAIESGSKPLYKSLHKVFDVDYPPTSAHRLWAQLPDLVREKGYRPTYPLIVTTNYDDLMERALQDAGQPYDVVSYVAEGEQLGKFRHCPPANGTSASKPVLIEVANEYCDFALDKRPVVFKIHGAIDRVAGVNEDSYVITEDHYIDYLTRTDVSSLIPITLLDKLRDSSILFLGYSLSDWNLRAILRRIWGEQELSYTSWAVQYDPDPIETKFWESRKVDIISIPMKEYVSELRAAVQELKPKGGRT
jgi:hypothetical protein